MYMRRFVEKYKRPLTLVAPALIGALYLILCLVSVQQSIWFDESYTAYLIRFDFGSILKYTAADVHPPLYYFLLKVWSMVFGYSDFALRAMSAMFGALAILFAFLWLKYKYGKTAAILGSLFLALSPNFIRYGEEMRMYTLVAAIVFAATYFLQLAIDNKSRKWWIIYAALVALGMYTHYFTAFAWMAHVIYLIVIYKKEFFTKKIFAWYLLSVVFYLPWLPGFLKQSSTVQGGFWIGAASVSKVANFFTETALYERASGTSNWLLVLFIAVSILFIYLTVRYYKQLKMLLCMTLVPIIGLILISMPPLKSMFVPRYLLYSMGAIAMMTGVELVLLARELTAKFPKRKKAKHTDYRPAAIFTVCLVVFLGSSIWGISQVYAKTNYNFETGSHPIAKEVFNDAVTLSGDENLPIIAATEWIYYDMSFYGSDEHPVYFIDEMTTNKFGSLLPLNDNDLGKIKDLDQFLEEHPRVIYLDQPSNGEELEFPRENFKQTDLLVMGHDDLTGNKFQAAIYEKE